jgi:predicted Rossmann-fold nucleotide-binding protein
MRSRKNRRREFDDQTAFLAHVAAGRSLHNYTLQGIDLTEVDLDGTDITGMFVLGCDLTGPEQIERLHSRGAFFFPEFRGLPYDPYRNGLYSVSELQEGWEEGGYLNTYDFEIYEHFDRARDQAYGTTIREALAQRLHDHSIDDALQEFLTLHSGRGVVGIMGGHSTPRADPWFRAVAYIAWQLTRRGYLVASGGGPGIMEAANLGAFLAPYGEEAIIDEAIELLSAAPKFDGGKREGTAEYLASIGEYVAIAHEVAQRFGADPEPAVRDRFGYESNRPNRSIAVPTWFYGHEPTNQFSNHIAKYFANSIREDGLLGISDAGVVFAPGSAGTLQEVFMDLAQNHYATFKERSPMCFLGHETFESVHELIQRFIKDKGKLDVYGDLVGLFETPHRVVEFIEAHPPRPPARTSPLYELVE